MILAVGACKLTNIRNTSHTASLLQQSDRQLRPLHQLILQADGNLRSDANREWHVSDPQVCGVMPQPMGRLTGRIGLVALFEPALVRGNAQPPLILPFCSTFNRYRSFTSLLRVKSEWPVQGPCRVDNPIEHSCKMECASASRSCQRPIRHVGPIQFPREGDGKLGCKLLSDVACKHFVHEHRE